jgi:DNA-binding GntR family transcriptional regulator
MPLPKDDGLETLANQVGAWLSERILTGDLRPGQWISENEIAAAVGVSRSPVREALRALAREGSVEVHPRRGTMIAEFTAIDVDNLYRARELVEPEMAGLAVERLMDTQVTTLKNLAGDLHDAGADVKAYYQLTEQLWNLLFEACPNQAIVDITIILWRRSIRFSGIVFAISDFQPVATEFADQLAAHAADRDGVGAKAAMAAVLDAMRKTLLDRFFLPASGGKVMRHNP